MSGFSESAAPRPTGSVGWSEAGATSTLERRGRLVLVGQTPPPFHGQAIATKLLFEHRWSSLELSTIRMAYSEKIADVGGVNWQKGLHLLKLAWRTVRRLGVRRSYLYYPPASPNLVPIIRDFVFLMLVRPWAKGIILHYHAAGLVSFLERYPGLQLAARVLYGGAVLSIEISRMDESPGRRFRASRIRHIPNGIDVPDDACDNRTSALPVVLYVGSIRASKGIFDLIETARILKGQGLLCRFVVVGEWASDRERLDALVRIRDAELERCIEFTGPLSGSEKWARFREAGIFFFPSYYESENFPMVLIEAMGAGLPIVASRWRGIPEVTGDGETAVLCSPRSPDEYAAGISELLRDPDLRLRMGQVGKARQRKSFSELKFQQSVEWEIAHAISAYELQRRNRLRRLLRPLGQWIVRLLGTEIKDQRTGKSLGKALLFPWRGRIVCVGLKNGVLPEFLPQKRLTYWRQELGFATPAEPDFSNEQATGRTPDSSGT